MKIRARLGILGARSAHEAILKLKRRLKRSERRLKRTPFCVWGIKDENLNNRNNKVPSFSLPSNNIRNRKSNLFKKARTSSYTETRLDIKFRGARCYNLKKFIEKEEEEIAEVKD